jgi:hypothetical protein
MSIKYLKFFTFLSRPEIEEAGSKRGSSVPKGATHSAAWRAK